MRIINTLTVTYDEHEDRLHLAARCADGHEQGLWLTQRLANLVIRVLVDRLVQADRDTFSASVPTTTLRSPGKLASAGGAGLAASEPSAGGANQNRQPVEVPRSTPHGLIHTINVVRHAGGGHHLILRWEANRALALPLDGQALRRVLQILHLRYQTADWPARGVWPDGIEASLQGGVPPDIVLH